MLESAGLQFIRSHGRNVEAKDVAHEHVDVAVVLLVERVGVTLDHVTKDVQTLGCVDLGVLAILAEDDACVDGLADSGLVLLAFL